MHDEKFVLMILLMIFIRQISFFFRAEITSVHYGRVRTCLIVYCCGFCCLFQFWLFCFCCFVGCWFVGFLGFFFSGLGFIVVAFLLALLLVLLDSINLPEEKVFNELQDEYFNINVNDLCHVSFCAGLWFMTS